MSRTFEKILSSLGMGLSTMCILWLSMAHLSPIVAAVVIFLATVLTFWFGAWLAWRKLGEACDELISEVGRCLLTVMTSATATVLYLSRDRVPIVHDDIHDLPLMFAFLGPMVGVLLLVFAALFYQEHGERISIRLFKRSKRAHRRYLRQVLAEVAQEQKRLERKQQALLERSADLTNRLAELGEGDTTPYRTQGMEND